MANSKTGMAVAKFLATGGCNDHRAAVVVGRHTFLISVKEVDAVVPFARTEIRMLEEDDAFYQDIPVHVSTNYREVSRGKQD